ncbi:hypothetical protein BLNAU_8401 [Blattamonas nauphoetae]|uniref:Right handed beta helix domain-containing protein n=1 Tax=Blattamonas nauphoetae TaxID=2049346 RepID=A0ABQ9XYL0_9EUKA|nr:hypothetical protein BLNAU_8401 [Blattamonas nauphoetae]
MFTIAVGAKVPLYLPVCQNCSPFLNWSEDPPESELERNVLLMSLVATVKSQAALDASLEVKAVKLLESLVPETCRSADSLLSNFASISDESLTDFVQSIGILLSVPNKTITTTAMKILDALLWLCSTQARIALIKAELIPQLINILNPQSLSFAEAEDIHTGLLSRINRSFWLTTPVCLAQLKIEDRDEQQAVNETILKQVVVPSEKIRQEPANLSRCFGLLLDNKRFSLDRRHSLLLLRGHSPTAPKGKPSILTIREDCWDHSLLTLPLFTAAQDIHVHLLTIVWNSLRPPVLSALRHLEIERRSDIPRRTFELYHCTGVSIAGIDLHIDSTWFSAGTGPLFSFGLTEEQWLLEAVPSLGMETALVGSSLANVTSRRVERRKNALFGGDVSQRVVGSEVGRSMNHNSGTAMMDGNLGGNVNCVNTSFWESMCEGNDDPSFTNENITDSHPIGRQEFNATSTATLISYSLCTFKNMHSTANRRGGAAILVNGTAASLSVKDCFFRRCQVNADHSEGGAICVWGIANSAQYFELRQSSFSECYSIGTYVSTGGCISLIFTSVTITDSFFEKGQAQYDGVLTLSNGTHSTLSNCAFVLCSASDRVERLGCATMPKLLAQVVSEGVFSHCDSTTRTKNECCISDPVIDSSLIPPIESVPTLSNVDIQFDDEQIDIRRGEEREERNQKTERRDGKDCD